MGPPLPPTDLDQKCVQPPVSLIDAKAQVTASVSGIGVVENGCIRQVAGRNVIPQQRLKSNLHGCSSHVHSSDCGDLWCITFVLGLKEKGWVGERDRDGEGQRWKERERERERERKRKRERGTDRQTERNMMKEHREELYSSDKHLSLFLRPYVVLLTYGFEKLKLR